MRINMTETDIEVGRSMRPIEYGKDLESFFKQKFILLKWRQRDRKK